jgi:hypothetical protein
MAAEDEKDEDKYKKKNGLIDSKQDTEGDSGESGESGQGGKSGQIEFKDFLAAERLRDDILPADEKRRLLSVHKDFHDLLVKKQKELRDQRQAVKDGKISLQAFRQGLTGKGIGGSQYKENPALKDKAQFSGIDRQVNQLPNDYISDTNEANRNELELENKLQLRYAPQNAPRFNPKPQFNR